ncbi:hypothetical protein JOE11_000665 [Robbsia andropogonis]
MIAGDAASLIDSSAQRMFMTDVIAYCSCRVPPPAKDTHASLSRRAAVDAYGTGTRDPRQGQRKWNTENWVTAASTSV